MEMIVQSIAEEIKVVEFHCPNPKFFRCGNTFILEVVSLLNIVYTLFQNGGCLRRSGSSSTRTRHQGPELEILCSFFQDISCSCSVV